MKTDQMNKNELLSGTINDNECARYYHTYINLSRGKNLFDGLEKGRATFLSTVANISDEDALFRYAERKWTLKEVIGHMIDTERVMAFRALCFARGEQSELPGFDQDNYVSSANFNRVPLDLLLNDYQIVRDATISLFHTFTPQMLMRNGVASNSNFTVRALGFIISGHELHHLDIIRKNYLPGK